MAARKPVVAAAPVVHANLNDALLAIQKGMPEFQKSAINPHFNSAYLSLEVLLPQVLEVLNANGVVLAQFPTFVVTPTGAVGALRTQLIHTASGEFAGDVMLLSAGKDGPQAQGSAITYAKRYAAMAILGITADRDDDANLAQPRAVTVAASVTPSVAGAMVDSLQGSGGFGGAL